MMSMLTSHLKLEDAEVSTNGQFEERRYKKFGLTIRRRRMLPELPPLVPEDGSEAPRLPQELHESRNGLGLNTLGLNTLGLNSLGLNNLALSIEAEAAV